MVALFGFSVPAFLMASFVVLCQTTEYKVSQKRIEKPKQIEGQAEHRPHRPPEQIRPLQNKEPGQQQGQEIQDEIQIVTSQNNDEKDDKDKVGSNSLQMMKIESNQQLFNEEEQGQTANEMAKNKL